MAEGAGTVELLETSGPLIALEANLLPTRRVAIVLLELAVVFFLVQLAYHARMSPNLNSGVAMLVGSLFMGAAFCWSEPYRCKQMLEGTRFRQVRGARGVSDAFDLLTEPDVKIMVAPTGAISIERWTASGSQLIEVLPDPTGRMQEALIEIGRLLPPGQFVDERAALLKEAR